MTSAGRRLTAAQLLGLHEVIAGVGPGVTPATLATEVVRALPAGFPAAVCLLGNPVARESASPLAALLGTDACTDCRALWQSRRSVDAPCRLHGAPIRVPVESDHARVGYFLLGEGAAVDDDARRGLGLLGRALGRTAARAHLGTADVGPDASEALLPTARHRTRATLAALREPRLVRGAAGLVGRPFLEALVHHLWQVLGLRYVFVGRLLDADHVQTIVMEVDGQPVDNIVYSLAGTPCEGVLNESSCILVGGVQEAFPEDLLLAEMGVQSYLGTPLRRRDGTTIGILVALHDALLEDPELADSVLRVNAERAAAELERLADEEALRRSEERYRCAVEEQSDAVLSWDPAGRLTFANRAFGELLGDRPERCLGTPLRELIVPTDRGLFDETLEGLSAATPATQLELRWQPRQGRPVICQLSIRARFDGEGHLVEYLGVGRDVTAAHRSATERRALERQLLRAQRMETVGRLAGGVAHDFANVLQVIGTCTELALADLPAEHEIRTELDGVTEAAARASALVRQLLTFSRREALAPIPLDLNALLAGLMKLLRRVVEARIELRLEAAPDLPVVEADPGQLEQAILNLVVNARDAMEGTGVIRLATRRTEADAAFCAVHPWALPGSYVEIAVSDTGPGVPPEIREQIFDPFFTTKPLDAGTGLGLSTVLVTMQHHRGHAVLETAPGEGATFRLLLPASSRRPTPAERPRISAAPRRGQGTVLLAEDDEFVQRVACRILERAGYHVLTAADGETALQVFLAQEAEIDVALLDLVMPRLGGREVSTFLNGRRPELPIIFFTGQADEELLREIRRSGWRLLRKPFRTEELLDAVAGALEGEVAG